MHIMVEIPTHFPQIPLEIYISLVRSLRIHSTGNTKIISSESENVMVKIFLFIVIFKLD